MKSISRRNLFKYGVGAVRVGGSVALGSDLLGVGGATAKTIMNPDSAIDALTQGNQRFSQKNATIANIKNQITELQSSRVLTDLIKAGSLKIVGGFYDLDTGIFTPVV